MNMLDTIQYGGSVVTNGMYENNTLEAQPQHTARGVDRKPGAGVTQLIGVEYLATGTQCSAIQQSRHTFAQLLL